MRYKIEPDEILDSIGIVEPEDLDLELISFELGATVEYEPLSDCEGSILGAADAAIITINSNSCEQRKRFSLGHELGHWINDRGENLALRCTREDMSTRYANKTNFRKQKEVRANSFAADLLMPSFMWRPIARSLPINGLTLRHLSKTFSTSLQSCAIRLIQESDLPCATVFYKPNGVRKWFERNELIPESMFPVKFVPRNLSESNSETVDADRWIDMQDVEDYTINESVFISQHGVLVLLWWEDEGWLKV